MRVLARSFGHFARDSRAHALWRGHCSRAVGAGPGSTPAEAWVNPANVTGWRNVILKQLTTNPSEGLAYALYAHSDGDGGPAAYIHPSGWGSDQHAAVAAALALNTWHHLAATYDGRALRLFLNGRQVATANVTTPISVSNLPLFIGGNPLWGEFFKGLIDDVRIYNRALTDAEIREDMETGVV